MSITTTSTRPTTRNAGQFIRAQVPFKTSGALAGYADPFTYRIDAARMRREAWEQFRADREDRHVTFVATSYGVPIGWAVITEDGPIWRRPDVKYSVTTSRHQGQVPRDGTRA